MNLPGDIRYFFHSIRACFLIESLSDAERQRYSVKDYNKSLMPDKADNGLFDWEESWFAAWLPPAPATILVCAAGTGREAIALKSAGYHVDALEPAADPAWVCKERLGHDSVVVAADFSELTAAVLRGDKNNAMPVVKTYDGVILGWGGLNHLLGHEDRVELLLAVKKICPDGPVLASFFMDPHAVARQQAGWGSLIGRTLGKMIARLRGLPPQREPVELTYWGGFIRHFRPQDILALGEESDLLIRWQQEGGFPHVTFVNEVEGGA